MRQAKVTQHGVAAVILLLLVFLIGTTILISDLNGQTVKLAREQKTAESLAQAKAALIAYSVKDLSSGTCTTNCPRPGDLPCPDINNDGTAESGCGNAAGTTQQQNRMGRLPWKTLGLDDLRDGNGDRLWYAVSNSYKYNTRTRPLNSDTNGTITLRDVTGIVVNDGSASTGLVAIVFSPGPVIRREDNIQQSRNVAQENVASNYLDTALGEDNASFVDGTLDGFIFGPIVSADRTIVVNDRMLTISRDEILPLVEQRVIAEAANALLDYYCGTGNANYAAKTCYSAGGNRFYPWPADFSDNTCLGTNTLGACNSNAIFKTHGRVPANLTTDWNSTSILRRFSSGNWFQQNGWREVLHYAVASACAAGTANCGGVGLLTLQNTLTPPSTNKQAIVIAAGHLLTGQNRASTASKQLEVNYLESENLVPLDDIYLRPMQPDAIFNDRAVSIP
jgi:hypothetical protein